MRCVLIYVAITFLWSCEPHANTAGSESNPLEKFKEIPDTSIFVLQDLQLDKDIFAGRHSFSLTPIELRQVKQLLLDFINEHNEVRQREFDQKRIDLPERNTVSNYYIIDIPQYRMQLIPFINERNEKEVWINAFTGQEVDTWNKKIVLKNIGKRYFFNCSVNLSSNGIEQFTMDDPAIFYPENEAWRLTWSEDFNSSSLNVEEWSILERGLNYNGEVQAYVKENVSIQNGKLILTAKREKWRGNPTIAVLDQKIVRGYTSGEVRTLGAWTYGKFEFRAKAAKTKGLISALWMTAASETWPPEIDIMEIVGHEPTKVYFTNHFGSHLNHQMNNADFQGPDFSNDYHLYAVEWEPHIMRWYVDGLKCYEVTTNIPTEPLYLRASLPIGADWAGQPDSSSTFPQTLEIDWVKVYQKIY